MNKLTAKDTEVFELLRDIKIKGSLIPVVWDNDVNVEAVFLQTKPGIIGIPLICIWGKSIDKTYNYKGVIYTYTLDEAKRIASALLDKAGGKINLRRDGEFYIEKTRIRKWKFKLNA